MVAADVQLELVARPDAEIARGQLGKGSPYRSVHEAGPDRQQELVAAVHATTHHVATIRFDPGVAVDVVGVGSAPLADQVVVAVEERAGGVGVEDRPPEPHHDLVDEVLEALEVGLGGAVDGQASSQVGQPLTRGGPVVRGRRRDHGRPAGPARVILAPAKSPASRHRSRYPT